MKHILAATDLSPSSEPAVARAIDLAARFRARLTVLHVVDERLPADIADALRLRAEQLIRAQLNAAAAAATGSTAAAGGEGEGDADVAVVVGDAFAEILNRAWAGRVDLVVMGTHRKAPVADLFRGTTVERVLRRADYPTLVVREPPRGGTGTFSSPWTSRSARAARWSSRCVWCRTASSTCSTPTTCRSPPS